MRSETMFDSIILRRLSFENIEMFDFIIDVDGYKRIVITNYKDENHVIVTTNLMELDTPRLFDVKGLGESNDALIVQSRLIFNSFVVDESEDKDFDLEIGIVDDKQIKKELKAFEKSQKDVTKYLEVYLESHDEVDEELFNLEDFNKLNDIVNEKSNVLDVIFLEESILEYLEEEAAEFLKFS